MPFVLGYVRATVLLPRVVSFCCVAVFVLSMSAWLFRECVRVVARALPSLPQTSVILPGVTRCPSPPCSSPALPSALRYLPLAPKGRYWASCNTARLLLTPGAPLLSLAPEITEEIIL